MPKRMFFLVLCVVFFSCTNYDKFDKTEFITSQQLPNTQLFVEIYRVNGFGVYGGDIESVYLTDSIKFRKYIGEKFDQQVILFEKNGDKVNGRKIELGYKIDDLDVPDKLIEKYEYSLGELKKTNLFE